jgi:UDP-N-acetylmuramate: L-alanyl-gamma-D-glutamyl-meso-diaminopimelate ligase
MHQDADAIVAVLAPEVRNGDIVAILSNGGFGGIYQKLPKAIKEAVIAARLAERFA